MTLRTSGQGVGSLAQFMFHRHLKLSAEGSILRVLGSDPSLLFLLSLLPPSFPSFEKHLLSYYYANN